MAKRGLTNKGERSRETYGENADMGRREGVCVIEDAPRDIEIDVWMEGDNTCVPDG